MFFQVKWQILLSKCWERSASKFSEYQLTWLICLRRKVLQSMVLQKHIWNECLLNGTTLVSHDNLAKEKLLVTLRSSWNHLFLNLCTLNGSGIFTTIIWLQKKVSRIPQMVEKQLSLIKPLKNVQNRSILLILPMS